MSEVSFDPAKDGSDKMISFLNTERVIDPSTVKLGGNLCDLLKKLGWISPEDAKHLIKILESKK